LIAQSGRLEESFFFIHGMPIWESSKWVDVNAKDMLVVPLLSNNNHNKKYIIGVVENGKISAVITELSETDISKNRIFSLNNKTLYDSEIPPSILRLKNGNEADYLLLNGGTAQALFAAANGAASYNPQANAGTLSIRATSSGTASSSNTAGHAWIEFTSTSGNTTTFGTWGNQGSVEYYVNKEKDYDTSNAFSYSIPITYAVFQNVLNYNAISGNTNWSLIYNCAGYAAGVWNAATGTNIGGGILTPSHIKNWINNQ
jgi:hypothetical protein